MVGMKVGLKAGTMGVMKVEKKELMMAGTSAYMSDDHLVDPSVQK